MNLNDKKQSILIVDDESKSIKILNNILKDEYKVFFATNGKNAIEFAERQKPDLILLDVMMPDMDGYEVCKKLKSSVTTKDIIVIFITAMSQETHEITGLGVGAVDYISKPFNHDIVKLRVNINLELKKHREFLENLSQIDGLTGIANRLKFDDYLDHEWKRAKRIKAQLSLIMIDIDYFKQFNDVYGHIAGDECLKRVAKTLAQSSQRSVDLVARYGGEEFVCVLPNSDADGALVVAENMRQMVASLNILHSNSKAASHVTISMGVSCVVPTRDSNSKNLIDFADKALYQAKKNGRNRVELFFNR